jgi:PhnB protein
MKLNPCINVGFNGQCEAAFKFYERCFGAQPAYVLKWGDSPMASQAPPEWGEKVAHATLHIGDFRLQGSDPAPGTYKTPQGFDVMLNMNDPTEAERVFASLSENGTVRMPLQETFWASRFGVVTDQFGIPWGINCEKPE